MKIYIAVVSILNKNEELMNELNVFRFLEVNIHLFGIELLSIVHEIDSILCLIQLTLDVLRNLLIGNVEPLSLEVTTVKEDASYSCVYGLLEADKGAGGGLSVVSGLFVVSGQDIDALDLTEMVEDESQVNLLVFGGEVLDVEVAFRSICKKLTLSKHSKMSRLNEELAAINLFIVQFLDSSLSRDDSSITIVGVLEADEGELALRVSGVLINEGGFY